MSLVRSGEKVIVVIHAEACSKANSRRMVPGRSKAGKLFMRPIKSEKALQFVDAAARQVPILPEPLTCALIARIWIWYPSERNDLDESLVLDVLQDRVYKNDRQIRERHVYHAVDKNDPRVVVELEPLYHQGGLQ